VVSEISVVCGFVKVIQIAPVYGCGVFFLNDVGKAL